MKTGRRYCSSRCFGAKLKTKVELTCQCGARYERIASRAERSKYCSAACRAKYTENFRCPKGRVPWNAGTAGQGLLPTGENHHAWKGDEAGYQSIHIWLRRWHGLPTDCEQCGSTTNVQWANRTGQYLRDRSDWLQLCQPCHGRYDAGNGLRGAIKERFKKE